jgi:hypothetical protein
MAAARPRAPSSVSGAARPTLAKGESERLPEPPLRQRPYRAVLGQPLFWPGVRRRNGLWGCATTPDRGDARPALPRPSPALLIVSIQRHLALLVHGAS